MQATIRLLSERKGGEFFLDIPSYRTSPLIGLIEESFVRVPGGWSATLPLRARTANDGKVRAGCSLPLVIFQISIM